MAQFFQIHPDDPQPRLIRQAVDVVSNGDIIVYPTDSGYALGCDMGNKKAKDRIRQIRRVDDRHVFTLVCRDLSEIATYAKVDNSAYRLLKALTPGPYTFILRATHEVPRRLTGSESLLRWRRAPGAGHEQRRDQCQRGEQASAPGQASGAPLSRAHSPTPRT